MSEETKLTAKTERDIMEANKKRDRRAKSPISDHMLSKLLNYEEHGTPVGGFLQAVIANDFLEAVGGADEDNLKILPAYASYVYNEMKSECHGSRAVYRAWIKLHQAKREGQTKEDLQIFIDNVWDAKKESSKV